MRFKGSYYEKVTFSALKHLLFSCLFALQKYKRRTLSTWANFFRVTAPISLNFVHRKLT